MLCAEGKSNSSPFPVNETLYLQLSTCRFLSNKEELLVSDSKMSMPKAPNCISHF